MRKYPDEVKQFIAENVKGRRVEELVKLTNEMLGTEFTCSKMRAFMKNHKLRNGMPTGRMKGEITGTYPQEIRDFIQENHKGVGPKDMAELLNKTFGTNYTRNQLKGYYGNNKINSGVTGYFPKRHTPANKGKKGYHAPGCEKGWFKKGHTPVTHRPVGSERIENKDGYTLIKTAEPNKWDLKHRVIWEEKHGAVPEGYVVIFLDGNKSNIKLDNLALITMAESLEMNRSELRSKNSEFTRTGILIAKVSTTRNKIKRQRRTRGDVPHPLK